MAKIKIIKDGAGEQIFPVTIQDAIINKDTKKNLVHDLSLKADKTYVDGKVKTDVPDGAKFTDTVYIHPETHPASIITESDTKRFVSDVEKDSWNNKLGKSEEEAISFALNELNNKIEDILKYIKQLNIMIEKNI